MHSSVGTLDAGELRDHPAVRELVIQHDRVAVPIVLADAAEAAPGSSTRATGASVLDAPVGIFDGSGAASAASARRMATATRSSCTTSSPTAGSITQFAGSSVPTDECIAVSTTSDATGTYNRYDFHLGSNFFDYPHLGVWPDGYYMSMNVFNSAGTAFLGPQPFAFDRAAMLAGTAATFVTSRDSRCQQRERRASCRATSTARSSPPGGAPATVRLDFRAGLDLEALALPRRLRHSDELDLHARRQPHSRRLTRSSARRLAVHPAAWPASRARRHRRPLHVPSCLPPLRRRPRSARRQLTSVSSAGWPGSAGSRSATSLGTADLCPAEHLPARHDLALDGQRGDGPERRSRLGFSASSATINPQIRYAGRLAGDPSTRSRRVKPRCSPEPAARAAPRTAGVTTAT